MGVFFFGPLNVQEYVGINKNRYIKRGHFGHLNG